MVAMTRQKIKITHDRSPGMVTGLEVPDCTDASFSSDGFILQTVISGWLSRPCP
jgi:hypothetical protein